MEPSVAIDILSRWVHVGTAVVLLGGSVFLRFVLTPSAETLPDAEHAALRDQVRGRWRKVVMSGIGLLLITGFFNFVRAIAASRGGGPPIGPLYHALMGTKILLSFAVFFLASALVGRSAAFEGLRRNSKTWLAVTIVLAFAVVALAGVVKVIGRGTVAAPSTSRDRERAVPGMIAARSDRSLTVAARCSNGYAWGMSVRAQAASSGDRGGSGAPA